MRYFLILCAVVLSCLKHSVLYVYLVKSACHLSTVHFPFI